jgi:hypothetical protein
MTIPTSDFWTQNYSTVMMLIQRTIPPMQSGRYTSEDEMRERPSFKDGDLERGLSRSRFTIREFGCLSF